jgi:hypothetical protein
MMSHSTRMIKSWFKIICQNLEGTRPRDAWKSTRLRWITMWKQIWHAGREKWSCCLIRLLIRWYGKSKIKGSLGEKCKLELTIRTLMILVGRQFLVGSLLWTQTCLIMRQKRRLLLLRRQRLIRLDIKTLWEKKFKWQEQITKIPSWKAVFNSNLLTKHLRALTTNSCTKSTREPRSQLNKTYSRMA